MHFERPLLHNAMLLCHTGSVLFCNKEAGVDSFSALNISVNTFPRGNYKTHIGDKEDRSHNRPEQG